MHACALTIIASEAQHAHRNPLLIAIITTYSRFSLDDYQLFQI